MLALLRHHGGQGRFDPRGLAVGAVRGHRLHGVGNRQDASLQADLIALQAPGVAAAIEAFMVLTHRFGHGPGKLNGAQRLVARFGMGAHQSQLLGGEAGGFGEDLGGDRELADVMHQTTDADPFHLLGRQLHLGGDRTGQGGDPQLMAGGVRIAGFVE